MATRVSDRELQTTIDELMHRLDQAEDAGRIDQLVHALGIHLRDKRRRGLPLSPAEQALEDHRPVPAMAARRGIPTMIKLLFVAGLAVGVWLALRHAGLIG